MAAKPAATLAEFDPALGRLLDYLMGRVKGKVGDLLLADQRRRRREHQVAARNGASYVSSPIDWKDEAAGLRPRLTREQWAFVLEALHNHYGPSPKEADCAAQDAAEHPTTPGDGEKHPWDAAFRQMVFRISQKAKEAETEGREEKQGKKKESQKRNGDRRPITYRSTLAERI